MTSLAWIFPLLSPPLHAGGFSWDELLCTGLVAIVLVIGAFVALRREDDLKESDAPESGGANADQHDA